MPSSKRVNWQPISPQPDFEVAHGHDAVDGTLAEFVGRARTSVVTARRWRFCSSKRSSSRVCVADGPRADIEQTDRMQEKESLPDLSLYLAQGVVIPSEVKDIHTSKNPNNLADVIGKANKQIKVVEPNGSGLLFLRIRRSTQAPGKDDGYPADIASHIASCVRCLNPSKYRSVAKIIAFWDDLTIVDARGMPFYAFRRNSVVIEHPAPRKPVPIEGKDLALGQTMQVWIERQSKAARKLRPGEKPLPGSSLG